jgi:glycosyltransferase involved in cell wall biosynthesis
VTDHRPSLLFASVHSYLDPSSGAALATRDLLELMAARGWECRALTAGLLDYEQDTPFAIVLESLGLAYDEARIMLARGGESSVYQLEVNGVCVTTMPTHSSRPDRAPGPEESRIFLDLVNQAIERFRPHVVLTYGGHPASLELMAAARRQGIAVVFHLHNFSYNDRRGFADASALLVPTECARRVYNQRLGRECVHIPLPLNPARVIAAERDPQYVTFVNPQVAKGAAVVARIAEVLGRRRPEIPFLIVESRAAADGLGGLGLDLSGLENLHRMANTPDPRDFYRISRIVLVPSLIENAALVAREALANGIPVLASDRGGLPETLGDAGFVFTLPERLFAPGSPVIPTAQEVAPWVAAIEKLWDDPELEARHLSLALAQARRWEPERLAQQYEQFFGCLADARKSRSREGLLRKR